MKRVVPYGVRISAAGSVEVFPVVRVTVTAATAREVAVVLVIDSGASVTLLPAIDAAALHLELEAGEWVSVRGVAGETLDGFRHYVTMNLEGFGLKRVPVVFSKRADSPRILGREGVFAHFGILFDEAKRRIGLLERRSERRAINRLLR